MGRENKSPEKRWAGVLRSIGFPAARYQPPEDGKAEALTGIPDTYCEVRMAERPNLRVALRRVAAGAAPGEVSYLAHRHPGGDWLVIVRAADLHALAAAVIAGRTGKPTAHREDLQPREATR